MEEYKFNLDKCNSIEVPSEIHNTINSSIIRAKVEQGKKKRIIKYFSSIAASLAIFVAFINMSPAIASNLSKVPGLEYLVELVTFDKGLRSAIENNFVQHINKNAEDKNIKLTIKDVIIDKKSMIIAYEIATKDKRYNDLNISMEPSPIEIIFDENNTLIGTIQLNYGSDESFKITGKKEGIITVLLNDNISRIPENIELKIKDMQDGYYEGTDYKTKRIHGEWKVSFGIDVKLANVDPYLYHINESINVGELNVLMKDMVIYPTSCEIAYEIKDNKDYKYINFINARLVDDRGQEYKMRGSKGYVGDAIGTLICESSYFTQSKELYFKADGALIIPKKDMYITIDVKNKKVLDDCGFGIELLYGRFEDDQKEKNYNVAFKVKDKEILQMSGLPGAYFGGIGYSEIIDEKNNIYRSFGVFSGTVNNPTTDEEYIESGVSIPGITEEPKILKLKVQYANKGLLKPINIKVK